MKQHQTALISYLSLLPLVYFIPDWLSLILPQHKLLNVAVTVAVIVVLMSYLIMPIVAKLTTKLTRLKRVSGCEQPC